MPQPSSTQSPDIVGSGVPAPDGSSLPGEERLLAAGRPSSALLPGSLVLALEIGGAKSQRVNTESGSNFGTFWNCGTHLLQLVLTLALCVMKSFKSEAHFGCLWGANSFRTPPGGRGFKAHHDEVEAQNSEASFASQDP